MRMGFVSKILSIKKRVLKKDEQCSEAAVVYLYQGGRPFLWIAGEKVSWSTDHRRVVYMVHTQNVILFKITPDVPYFHPVGRNWWIVLNMQTLHSQHWWWWCHLYVELNSNIFLLWRHTKGIQGSCFEGRGNFFFGKTFSDCCGPFLLETSNM